MKFHNLNGKWELVLLLNNEHFLAFFGSGKRYTAQTSDMAKAEVEIASSKYRNRSLII